MLSRLMLRHGTLLAERNRLARQAAELACAGDWPGCAVELVPPVLGPMWPGLLTIARAIAEVYGICCRRCQVHLAEFADVAATAVFFRSNCRRAISDRRSWDLG
jgi:hypothetical protein